MKIKITSNSNKSLREREREREREELGKLLHIYGYNLPQRVICPEDKIVNAVGIYAPKTRSR